MAQTMWQCIKLCANHEVAHTDPLAPQNEGMMKQINKKISQV
jgi:hypothetical protein